jgi:type I restriction enzyme, R subunit
MRGHRGTETEFELTTIERLEQQGYTWLPGEELGRPDEAEVVLRDRLRNFLARRYPDLPPSALDEAVTRLSRPGGVDTIRRNLTFHQQLTRGFELKVDLPDGRSTYRHLYPVDWENPEANDFLAVNQLPIQGNAGRRPDLVVYVNGLPLVVFELKNPFDPKPTVAEAHNQLQHYVAAIPQIFDFNAVCIVSDGRETLHGMWTAGLEWYAPWNSIDGQKPEPSTVRTMKVLVEGLFPKDRLLAYVRDFIAFEVVNDKVTKKGAKYHQFFAVRRAAEKARHAMLSGGDQRIGVIWHTTGSGKSLSMAFLVGLLRRMPELGNPSFVIQVDRNDLDQQLYDQFLAVRSLVGSVKQAASTDDLRDALRSQGGEVIFSTIEKFRLKPGETKHATLSQRSNIVVIADEAHRSQYGFLNGYARYLREALPNARRIGFTGTPISFSGADTVEVFGDVIHTYDIKQSQEDGATVPIWYSPRQIPIKLKRKDMDDALDEIAAGAEDLTQTELERKKTKWAALAAAAGADDRVAKLAKDLLAHFQERDKTLDGKAMLVCMTRANCVKMFHALRAEPGCPELKVVMTGDLGEDPKEWSQAGHLTTKKERETIKQRMIDAADPLKIVIVCDMWLTGTDIPCLHTLYVDKPMRGHSIIQAISRVNRVFKDKPHGLVVDYIGIGDDLRAATTRYTDGGGEGAPAPDIEKVAVPLFLERLSRVRATMPASAAGQCATWRKLTKVEFDDFSGFICGTLLESDERRDSFLQAERQLTAAYLLVKHLPQHAAAADEIIFYQRVRKEVSKTLGVRASRKDMDAAVRDLVDDAIETEGVIDIFQVAGIEKPDISILDDKFLQTFKGQKHENLRVKLLEALLRDAIGKLRKKNPVQARSFQEMLEKTIQRYHARLIDAAAVIEEIVRQRQTMVANDQRAERLGLVDDELAFYDALAASYETVYEQPLLSKLVHETVQTLKRNLKVDWTEPHRDSVWAEIRAAVRRTLRKNNVRDEDLEPFVDRVMACAKEMYADWPVAA